MPQFDLPLSELESYRSESTPPLDFADFWTTTLAQTSSHPLEVQWSLVETGLVAIDTFAFTFAGYGGAPISAWLRLPSDRGTDPLPTVVQFHGYNGGRGELLEVGVWPLAGFAHLAVDTRGQGAGWRYGSTPDPAGGSGAEVPGFMTRGILSAETYYFRRVFADTVRAIEAVREHPRVDRARTLVTGISQGGGLSIAAAGLVPDLAGVMADVPFLSDFTRALVITDRDPYGEIARFLRTQRSSLADVMKTLSYFDISTHAIYATAPALFSVALMDATCPPSTVYAAYNAYAGAKQIVVYPFNDHEGGQIQQEAAKLAWARALVA